MRAPADSDSGRIRAIAVRRTAELTREAGVDHLQVLGENEQRHTAMRDASHLTDNAHRAVRSLKSRSTEEVLYFFEFRPLADSELRSLEGAVLELLAVDEAMAWSGRVLRLEG